MVPVVAELALMGLLGTEPEEAVDLRSAMCALEPGVAGAPFEVGGFGLTLEGLAGRQQELDVDSVINRGSCTRHFSHLRMGTSPASWGISMWRRLYHQSRSPRSTITTADHAAVPPCLYWPKRQESVHPRASTSPLRRHLAPPIFI